MKRVFKAIVFSLFLFSLTLGCKDTMICARATETGTNNSTVQNYNLTVDPNGGTFSNGKTTAITVSPQLVYGKGYWWNIDIYTPTLDDLDLLGWYTKPTGGTKVYNADGTACNEGTYFKGNEYVYEGDLTVYAQWGITYNLTLDPNGGAFKDGNTEQYTVSPKLVYNKGYWWDIGSLTPSKDGYALDGWYTESSGGTKVYGADGIACNDGKYFQGKEYVYAGDLTVYAQWLDIPLPFSDVDADAWYYNSVKTAYAKKYMSGRGDGTFGPDINISRSEIATVLYSLEGKPSVEYTNQFNDVSDGIWYSLPISWAYQNGIVSGYGDGVYGVNDDITREQLAVMLFSYAKLKEYDITYTDDAIDKYVDHTNISDWATTAMNWALSKGIMSGKGVGDDISTYRLDPTGTATRAECAAMLSSFSKAYGL